MATAFTRARFADIEQEIRPLWGEHWQEIGQDSETVPLEPDLAKYRALDAGGFLEITAARRDGVLVGYLFSLLDRHLHYAGTLCAGHRPRVGDRTRTPAGVGRFCPAAIAAGAAGRLVVVRRPCTGEDEPAASGHSFSSV